ncbi:MAG: hypothetical protein AAF675_01505 [Pseudomonadota bacterium]
MRFLRRTSGIVVGSLLLALLPHSTETAEDRCPGGAVKGFGELAERLEDLKGVTVLGAELLVSPTRACRETWVVELLTEEGEVRALILDARTLEERYAGTASFEGGIDEDDFEEDDVFPVRMRLAGGPTNDLIEGDWSDDVMSGGAGRDLFVVTPGSDIIVDFKPGEDILEVGDFARSEDGFGTLRSMADIRRLSTSTVMEGKSATAIALAPGESDWAVVLVGVSPRQLTRESIFFGLEAPDDPEVELTHWPAREVRMSDGSVVHFPRYGLEDRPPAGRLIQGSDKTLEVLRDMLIDFWRGEVEDD